jgi:hypothetical protein
MDPRGNLKEKAHQLVKSDMLLKFKPELLPVSLLSRREDR